MSNYGLDESYMHVCECQTGWSGHACDLCVTAPACQALYNSTVEAVCDKTAIIIARKVFDCDSTDPQLEQLGIHNLSFAIQFDVAGLSDGLGQGTFQGRVGPPSADRRMHHQRHQDGSREAPGAAYDHAATTSPPPTIPHTSVRVGN